MRQKSDGLKVNEHSRVSLLINKKQEIKNIMRSQKMMHQKTLLPTSVNHCLPDSWSNQILPSVPKTL